jgi:RNA polymerase sigma-70 factor (ECF subfamily)
VCRTELARRARRVLPHAFSPAVDGRTPPGEPVTESAWLEPYPDEALEIEDGYASPEASYEEREAVELAFVAAMQHLPPRQRAVLILREVLGFSAQEVGETLDTSVPSVNSALQRARKTVEEKMPARSQQLTLRALGEARLREIVEEYMDAMRGGDVNRVVSMLTADVAWSMPPLASYFQGREDVRQFLASSPLSGAFNWKRVAARANGQPAIAAYTWHPEENAYLPFALDVLSLRPDGRIAEVTAFIARTSEDVDNDIIERWPDITPDQARAADIFARFGLPAQLEA